MSDAEQPIQLPLTEEQKELIHKITGEHVFALELTPDPTDGSKGTGRGIRFNWRISVDSGIPRQQWILGGGVRPPSADGPSQPPAGADK
jgi:hypothetical protein